MDEFGRVWTSLDEFGRVWTSLDEFGQVWTSLDKWATWATCIGCANGKKEAERIRKGIKNLSGYVGEEEGGESRV